MEDSNSLLQQRKFEILLEMFQKRYDAELNSLKQQIVSLNDELSSLKDKLNNIQTEQTEKLEIKKPIQSSSNNAEPLKPRTGDFKPGDDEISIEKFFYFGGK